VKTKIIFTYYEHSNSVSVNRVWDPGAIYEKKEYIGRIEANSTVFYYAPFVEEGERFVLFSNQLYAIRREILRLNKLGRVIGYASRRSEDIKELKGGNNER